MIGQVVYRLENGGVASGRVVAVHRSVFCTGELTPYSREARDWELLVEVDGVLRQWRGDSVFIRHPNPGAQSETPHAPIKGAPPCGLNACPKGGCRTPSCVAPR